jgi:hypothetical protein
MLPRRSIAGTFFGIKGILVGCPACHVVLLKMNQPAKEVGPINPETITLDSMLP